MASKRVKSDDTVTEDFDDATLEELVFKLIRHVYFSFNLNKKLKKDRDANLKFVFVIDEIDNFSKTPV